MKINPCPLFWAGAALLLAASNGFAQAGKNNGPTGKIYFSEAAGASEVQSGGKIAAARQATAFDAPGTIIETREKAHNAFVYSNGTGVYVDESTRLEISRFHQEPFKPDRNLNADAPVEPSISQSEVNVPHGFVGICTGQLVAGSSMIYSTALAQINIQGGKVAIQSSPDETIVYLLEGNTTVRAGAQDVGGKILRPGERAVIRPGAAGQPAQTVIEPIPRELMPSLDDRVGIACNSRKTVSFDIDQTNGSPEIVPKPTIPANPPANIVISPDRLPGT